MTAIGDIHSPSISAGSQQDILFAETRLNYRVNFLVWRWTRLVKSFHILVYVSEVVKAYIKKKTKAWPFDFISAWYVWSGNAENSNLSV